MIFYVCFYFLSHIEHVFWEMAYFPPKYILETRGRIRMEHVGLFDLNFDDLIVLSRAEDKITAIKHAEHIQFMHNFWQKIMDFSTEVCCSQFAG